MHETICISEDTLQDVGVESIAELCESELRNPKMMGNSTFAVESVTVQIGDDIRIEFHGREDFIKELQRLFH